jgi:hypothetical protein
MSSTRSLLAAMASVRAFVAAFLGSLAWFIWAETQQTSGSCYTDAHYVPSAAIALGVVVAATVSSRWPWRGRPTLRSLVCEGVAAAIWSAAGLLIAIFFAAATGCSA